MQIVIDISDGEYEAVRSHPGCFNFAHAILNGTPLPEHHGRIMDVDEVIKKMEEREERLKDDRSMYESSCVETAIDMFGETIIEADKAESEVKNDE